MNGCLMSMLDRCRENISSCIRKVANIFQNWVRKTKGRKKGTGERIRILDEQDIVIVVPYEKTQGKNN